MKTNLINLCLSLSFFLSSLFHQLQLFFLLLRLLALKWERCDVGRRNKCGQDLHSWEELILSFTAWNSLQNHLLTSCSIMVMLTIFFLSLAQSHRKSKPNLIINGSICCMSPLMGKRWVLCWIQIGSSSCKSKTVIHLLIADLWNRLLLVRDEEKSYINHQFSSNQGLMKERGSSAQSEDQMFEGFIFLQCRSAEPRKDTGMTLCL